MLPSPGFEDRADASRVEFDAHIKAALALAQQLKQKLLDWGERMEK